MSEFIKWANGSATKRNSTVGPRHDPYSRDTVEVTVRGTTTKFVSCALAGEYIVSPDGIEIVANHYHPDDVRDVCVKHTGQSYAFWMERVWRLRDRAAYRKDPEAYMIAQAMEEAEYMAYGRYI